MAIQHRSEDSMSDLLEKGRAEASAVRSDFADLASDLGTLAQKEMELARTEVGESVSSLVRAAALGAATLALGMLLLTFLGVSLMLVLDQSMELWAAALVTTAVILALTAAAGIGAYAFFRKVSVVPKRTMTSLQEDVQWARSQLNLNGS